jgi:hypothetical protein
LNWSSWHIGGADGRCEALDLSGGDALNGAEPVKGRSDVDQGILGVGREVRSCDGEQSATIIAASSWGN